MSDLFLVFEDAELQVSLTNKGPLRLRRLSELVCCDRLALPFDNGFEQVHLKRDHDAHVLECLA